MTLHEESNCNLSVAVLVLLFLPVTVKADMVEYDLIIARQEVTITGKPVQALTVNGSI